jgi:hypothetical protein
MSFLRLSDTQRSEREAGAAISVQGRARGQFEGGGGEGGAGSAAGEVMQAEDVGATTGVVGKKDDEGVDRRVVVDGVVEDVHTVAD